MTNWVSPGVDGVTSATPLALLKAGEATAEMPGIMDLFLGNVGGSIGETSALALLIGAAYLINKKVISIEIPVAFIGTFGIFIWMFGGEGIFTGNIMYHLLSGGLILGAFFMATDYSTSPVTKIGRIIMGFGCGLLAAIIRLYTNYPEGVSFAILLMNIVVPLIDRYTVPKVFGAIKAVKLKMRDVIKPGIILFLVASIVCAMLAFTNFITKDVIAERENVAAEESRKSVFKDADSFEKIDIEKGSGELTVKESFKALVNGKHAGSVITVISKGYGGEMLVTVGVDNEGKLMGVDIGANNETPGLGSKAKEEPFISQFKVLSPKEVLSVVKSKKTKAEEIEAISGATITSKAVTNAVQKAVDTAKVIKTEGGSK